jgi:FlaA1/EpsC-like NDP-sugar epimerase
MQHMKTAYQGQEKDMSPISMPASRIAGDRTFWRSLISFGDLVTFGLAALLAFGLRFDGAPPRRFDRALVVCLCVWALTKTITFMVVGVNRRYWHHTSIYDAQRVALANTAGSILGGLILIVLGGHAGVVPRSVYALEWIISCFLLLGTRLVIRLVAAARRSRWTDGEGTRTLIYGAGSAGLQLLWEARQNRNLLCDVVGLIDDDPSKMGLILDGKKVLGTGDSLKSLARKHNVKRVLIAMPSATGPQMVRILRLAADAGVEYNMVPSLGELILDKKLGGQIRKVAVEDLLGRQSIQLDQAHITERIQGKVVMVTGAAGSIGSELCRQIARFRPLALIGFDQAETPLFQLDSELRKTFPDLTFHAEIGDITVPDHLEDVMERLRPAVLYHAAAYKHVPLMEKHVFAAVENNIFGTWRTATAAIKYGVEDFVMISTDKAVRPTSVMGATKRVAELLIRSLQLGSPTRFVAVRFGNVLGSNGSVVPIFRQQIAAGGPVTVTHAEMRRYFMTIPEAAQLVLQASSLGGSGEVFLLDMGEPIKIFDLAINMILLSGLKPHKDIPIHFTGLRPGEKLFEELNLDDESLLPTLHAKIRRYVSPSSLDYKDLRGFVRELEQVVRARHVAGLIDLFEAVIPDYSPSTSAQKAAVGDRHSSLVEANRGLRPNELPAVNLSALPEPG